MDVRCSRSQLLNISAIANSLFGFSFIIYIYYLFTVFFLEKPYITFLAHYAYTTKLYYA